MELIGAPRAKRSEVLASEAVGLALLALEFVVGEVPWRAGLQATTIV